MTTESDGNSAPTDSGPSTAATAVVDVRPYDFRHPARLGPERTRSLGLVHDALAIQLSTVVSATLRTLASVTHEGVTETSFGAFTDGLPTPTNVSVVTLHPLPGAALIRLPLSGALRFVDLMLGGRGRPVPERAITDLEVGLIRPMLERVVAELATVWRTYVEVRPELRTMESDPEFVKVAAPSDAVIVSRFRLELATAEEADPTIIDLCYPYAMLQPILEGTGGALGVGSAATPAVRAQVAQRLAQSTVDLSVQFESRQMSGLEILNLRPGDVLSLPHGSGAPLTVFVGDVPVLEVQPTRSGNRVAARVTRSLGAVTDVTGEEQLAGDHVDEAQFATFREETR